MHLLNLNYKVGHEGRILTVGIAWRWSGSLERTYIYTSIEAVISKIHTFHIVKCS